jgi:hypothetical protein
MLPCSIINLYTFIDNINLKVMRINTIGIDSLSMLLKLLQLKTQPDNLQHILRSTIK